MVSAWPAVSYNDWRATCDTLHAHTQVLGKLAVKLAPPEPQLQHAALRLTARGWETAPLPAPDGSGALVIALDLRRHLALIEHSAGGSDQIALTPNRPVGRLSSKSAAPRAPMVVPVKALNRMPRDSPCNGEVFTASVAELQRCCSTATLSVQIQRKLDTPRRLRSRIFLRKVLRFRPRISAALI